MKAFLAFVLVISIIAIIVKFKWFFITLAVLGIAAFIGYKIYKKNQSVSVEEVADVPAQISKSTQSRADAVEIEGPIEDPKKPETKQKWNVKLGVYDTPLYGCEQKILHGAGMEHYMDSLMELATEDLNYTCTKKEMRDFLIINRRVFQYKFNPTQIDLVPEPDNIYDKNAVKIILNDRHVGYIKASEAEGAADLFNSERVKRIQVSIQGGKYKILLGNGTYFDGSEPLSEFDLEKGEAPFSIKIYLDVENE